MRPFLGVNYWLAFVLIGLIATGIVIRLVIVAAIIAVRIGIGVRIGVGIGIRIRIGVGIRIRVGVGIGLGLDILYEFKAFERDILSVFEVNSYCVTCDIQLAYELGKCKMSGSV